MWELGEDHNLDVSLKSEIILKSKITFAIFKKHGYRVYQKGCYPSDTNYGNLGKGFFEEF